MLDVAIIERGMIYSCFCSGVNNLMMKYLVLVLAERLIIVPVPVGESERQIKFWCAIGGSRGNVSLPFILAASVKDVRKKFTDSFHYTAVKGNEDE